MKQSQVGRVTAGAAVLLTSLVALGWSEPSQGASSRTIVGQSVYVCQSKPNGFPEEDYDVTFRISLDAPESVSPGQTVSLSGTATMQFPEKAYQEGRQMGVTEADGYSDTLSVATTVNGRTTDVPANRWQTPPFPWRDPVVVSAPITLHPFTVPENATGSVSITLPRNERRAPNTATDNPATVAFNGVANNKTAAGNVPENLGCYLQGAAPSTIGTIPITTAAAGPGAASSGTSTAGAPASQPGATAGGGAPGAGPAQPQGGGKAPKSAPGVAGAAASTRSTGSTGSAQYAGYQPASTRSGVFVSTDLLLLGGGFTCMAALAYALLAQVRLRNLKRTMDGR